MNKVVVVAAAASAASALIALAPAHRAAREGALAAAGSRPSVVLLIAEGVAPRPTGTMRVAPTPNLDRLDARGRRFDAAYAQYPAPGASRASLLLGWRPERTGVWGDPEGPVEGATPLPERFHAAGYFTERVGPVTHGKGETDDATWVWAPDRGGCSTVTHVRPG